MKLTVVCRKCGKILSMIEKDQIDDADMDLYESTSSCSIDGPFPAVMGVDDNGDPIELTPAVDNDIVAVKTES